MIKILPTLFFLLVLLTNCNSSQSDPTVLKSQDGKKQWTWQQFKLAIITFDVSYLSRNASQLQRYLQFKNYLSSYNMTMGDHIKMNVFGESGTTVRPTYYIQELILNYKVFRIFLQFDEDDQQFWKYNLMRKGISAKPIDIQKFLDTKQTKIIVTCNDYQYELLTGIFHFVMWSTVEITLLQSQYIMNLIVHQQDFIVHINPPIIKSVPDIFHSHIFLRITDQLKQQFRKQSKEKKKKIKYQERLKMQKKKKQQKQLKEKQQNQKAHLIKKLNQKIPLTLKEQEQTQSSNQSKNDEDQDFEEQVQQPVLQQVKEAILSDNKTNNPDDL